MAGKRWDLSFLSPPEGVSVVPFRFVRNAVQNRQKRNDKSLKSLWAPNQRFRGIVCFQALKRRFISPFSPLPFPDPNAGPRIAERCLGQRDADARRLFKLWPESLAQISENVNFLPSLFCYSRFPVPSAS
jgi:hypothetical protein